MGAGAVTLAQQFERSFAVGCHDWLTPRVWLISQLAAGLPNPSSECDPSQRQEYGEESEQDRVRTDPRQCEE